MEHFSHEHSLILKAEEHKINDDTHYSDEVVCDGCSMSISGPFYTCLDCGYFLHKVCAELPIEMDHPMHPEHPLTLLSQPRVNYPTGRFRCNLCREPGSKFVYNCSICLFDVDMRCASATHVIQDKCHPHPLTPLQVPIAFPCHVCCKKEEGLSYKCNICPFWVHQNCTILSDTVKHSHHRHPLTLLPSLPFEHYKVSFDCDICYEKLFMFQCTYSCIGCLFFSHVICARSETVKSFSRDQNIEINQDLPPDCQTLVRLPIQQDSTDLISRFVRNYIDGDANIDNMVNHFDHQHPLFPNEEHTNGKTCEACVLPISHPSYGCECGYFLHKCCTELPKEIYHPLHPQHRLILWSAPTASLCKCCYQLCNSFFYKCSECQNFGIDIKCASLQEFMYYEAHEHPLTTRLSSSSTCTACKNNKQQPEYILQCDTCSFKLCFICAMAPPVMKHRYGKSDPFILTYFPPENHYTEYICELCEEYLNPKEWFYHCVYADQFVHISCMLLSGADSNIKYGKSYQFDVHEHKLTWISCTYNCSSCTYCHEPLRTGFSIGLECLPCNFRIHIFCLAKMIREKRELRE